MRSLKLLTMVLGLVVAAPQAASAACSSYSAYAGSGSFSGGIIESISARGDTLTLYFATLQSGGQAYPCQALAAGYPVQNLSNAWHNNYYDANSHIVRSLLLAFSLGYAVEGTVRLEAGAILSAAKVNRP